MRKFAASFSNKDKIQPLLNAESEIELIEILNDLLGNMLVVEEV